MTGAVNGVPLPVLGGAGESGAEDAPGYRAFGEADLLGETPPMLEFRLKSGAVLALAYAWLARAEFDPTAGIDLSYGDTVVTVRGRNLAPVFASIVRRAAQWIAEADRASQFLAEAGVPVVEAIETVPNETGRGRSRSR